MATKFTYYDLLHAFDSAASFLDNEEWPEPDDKLAQEAAFKAAAKRIRLIINQIENKVKDLNKQITH